ncbi:MAG: 50S ribosomal protein L25 [Deltaproteobacteria bacterium]|nr:50S ribosomal protein L25 [Deltaproteobacteria bacterium]
MEFVKVEATVRYDRGKGACRRLRREGFVPAILYGQGKETVALSVSPKELVTALAGPLRGNTVLSISINDRAKKSVEERMAMVRDHQYEPLSRVLRHVDFLAVDPGREVRVEVPVRFEGRSLGEAAGGQLMALHRTVTMDCLPSAIPVVIVADVTNVTLNGHLTVKELAAPEGARFAMSPDTNLVSCQLPKREEKPATVAEEGAEGEAAAAEGEGGEKAEGAAKEGEPAKDDAKDKGKDKGKGKGKEK